MLIMLKSIMVVLMRMLLTARNVVIVVMRVVRVDVNVAVLRTYREALRRMAVVVALVQCEPRRHRRDDVVEKLVLVQLHVFLLQKLRNRTDRARVAHEIADDRVLCQHEQIRGAAHFVGF